MYGMMWGRGEDYWSIVGARCPHPACALIELTFLRAGIGPRTKNCARRLWSGCPPGCPRSLVQADGCVRVRVCACVCARHIDSYDASQIQKIPYGIDRPNVEIVYRFVPPRQHHLARFVVQAHRVREQQCRMQRVKHQRLNRAPPHNDASRKHKCAGSQQEVSHVDGRLI
jgi:hypothetical protein